MGGRNFQLNQNVVSVMSKNHGCPVTLSSRGQKSSPEYGGSGLQHDYTVRVKTGQVERPPVGSIDKKFLQIRGVPCTLGIVALETGSALGRLGFSGLEWGAVSDLGVAVVIEDDLDMRNLLEGVLLQSGFVVYTAADGRAGVEVVRDRMPDVVTLDVGLPDIDGFEVLRRIRQFSNAYVVMLTGRTEQPDLLAALQASADDYITKPFRPRELRARIAAMMRRPRPQTPEIKPSESPLEPSFPEAR